VGPASPHGLELIADRGRRRDLDDQLDDAAADPFPYDPPLPRRMIHDADEGPRMPMPRVRITTRRMMLLVALASVLACLAGVAIRVRDDPDGRWLYHVRADSPDPHSGSTDIGHAAPIWPRYWRRLLGRPWPGSFACDCPHGSPPPGTLAATHAGPGGRNMTPGERRTWSARHRQALDEARRKATEPAAPARE